MNTSQVGQEFNQRYTRKINIEPEHDGLEDYFPLHLGDLWVPR